MAVLYINSKEVCAISDDFSQLIYYSDKDHIDYDSFKKSVLSIKKEKIYVVVNSFYTYYEYINLSKVASDIKISNFLKSKMYAESTICSNYNCIFVDEKSINKLSFEDDIVFTSISKNIDELHISKIFNLLENANILLDNAYDFTQLAQTIYMSYKKDNKTLNINIVVLNSKVIISVSNRTHFLFGRLLGTKNEDTIEKEISSLLRMVVSYIETTYEKLDGIISVRVISNKDIDILAIQNETSLQNIKIEKKDISYVDVSSLSLNSDLKEELIVLKSALVNVDKCKYLTNRKIEENIFLKKIEKFLSFSCIGVFLLFVLYILYFVYTIFSLNKDINLYSRQLVEQQRVFIQKEQEISGISKGMTRHIVNKFSKINIDTTGSDILLDIGKVLQKHKNFIDFEEYKFSCKDCITDKKKILFAFDIKLFNITKTNVSYQQINNLINDLYSVLSKKYSNVTIFSRRISEDNKLYFNSEDIDDTIYVSCSNDKNILLPEHQVVFEKMFKEDE